MISISSVSTLKATIVGEHRGEVSDDWARADKVYVQQNSLQYNQFPRYIHTLSFIAPISVCSSNRNRRRSREERLKSVCRRQRERGRSVSNDHQHLARPLPLSLFGEIGEFQSGVEGGAEVWWNSADDLVSGVNSADISFEKRLTNKGKRVPVSRSNGKWSKTKIRSNSSGK